LLEEKEFFFQRSNPNIEISFDNIVALDVSGTFASKINSIDSLAEYIKCLRPISNNVEMTYADNQLKNADLKLMQQFFYNFWLGRNKLYPEQDWKQYLAQVNYVNRFYGSQINKGYETDKGRVYLQYGTPNSITDKKFESQYLPYEIWHYYEALDQRDIKFVFYQPNLAVNEYLILHSTAKGEIYNPNWEYQIRVSPTGVEEGEKRANDDFDLVR
jgi:GWxTD domain-containing protein